MRLEIEDEAKGEKMDTKIIELRMSVQSLPTDSRQVQLAVKAEVLRLAELLDKQLSRLNQRAADDLVEDGFGSSVSIICPRCGGRTMQVVRPGDFRCSACE